MPAIKTYRFPLPSMSHNSGVISATFQNGSVLSRTISADVALAANTLYYVYLVSSGGAATLRISTNVNSVGPAGFGTWTLIGAFYSDVRLAFGSFVTIFGLPSTTNFIEEGFGLGGGLTGFFNGFPSFLLSYYQWTREGIWLSVNLRMDNTQGNATSARIPFPRNITNLEVTKNVGTYAGQNSGATAGGGSIISLGGTSDVGFGGPNFTGSAVSFQTGSFVAGATLSTIVAQFRTKISQWSSRPLVDL